MSILWRSWITLAAVIATVLAVLATLVVLQHDSTLSRLTRERLSVVAQTTASSFRTLVDLGLPLSMIRNGNGILAESQAMDPNITAVEVFDPAGNIVYSTQTPMAPSIADAVLRAQRFSEGLAWGLESETSLESGYSIVNASGQVVGGVVVDYAQADFAERSSRMATRTILAAAALWIVFSAAGFVVLRLLLAGPIRGLTRLRHVIAGDEADTPAADKPGDKRPAHSDQGLLRGEIRDLQDKLAQANVRFNEAKTALETLDPATADNIAPAPAPILVGKVPGASLARMIARRLAPWAAGLVLGSALILGAISLSNVNDSLEPELAARTALIGIVVENNVERAVSAGVPIDELVGAERYFGNLLSELPEVAYIAVATGRIVLEAGQRVDPYLAPPRDRKDVLTYPIEYDDEEIGYVIIDIDPGFISSAFLDVFLDYGVVLLVTILIAYEVMVLTASVSLTAPFDRLQHLLALQAASDFSKSVTVRSGTLVDTLTQRLSARAEELHTLMAGVRARLASSDRGASLREKAEHLAGKFGLGKSRPTPLIFSYFTDIRLVIFLFVAADDITLSFFPIFVRSAENPWEWMDESLVISLPLAGYLLAILIIAPYARELAHRFGNRSLLLVAMAVTMLAHLGLYFSTTVPEIILFRTLTGVGYAATFLACQDYVLDVVPKTERNRALNMYEAVTSAGIFAAAAIGGVLADRLGQTTVFAISAALVLVALILIAKRMPAIKFSDTTEQATPRLSMGALFTALKNRRLAALVFGIAIPSNVLLQAFISYLAALLMNAQGASSADIGRVLMLYFLAIAFVGPLCARYLERRVHASLLTAAGALIPGLALLVPAADPTLLATSAAIILCGIGAGMNNGPQVSIAMGIAETELAHLGSNTVLGALRSLERGGSIVGLLIIASIAGAAGYQAALGAMAAWTLAGFAYFAVVAAAADGRKLLRRPGWP